MLAIDMPLEEKSMGDQLCADHPDIVAVIERRAIDGTIDHWTLFLSAAALSIPAINKIVVAIIESNRHRTITYKGIKLQGFKADEIKSIVSDLRKLLNQK
jgi:hypothetical protein